MDQLLSFCALFLVVIAIWFVWRLRKEGRKPSLVPYKVLKPPTKYGHDGAERKRVCAVLGGTGFIGSCIIDELVRRGNYQVYVLGRKFRPKRANPKVDAFIQVDMQDSDGMVKALEGVDSVINAAAAIPSVFSTAEDMWRINKDGQLCVLKAAQKTGVKSYILVGSMYPKRPPGDPLAKTWQDSKAAGEKLVIEMDKQGGLRTCVIPVAALVLGRKSVFVESILSGKITSFPMAEYPVCALPVEYLAKGVVNAEQKLAASSEDVMGKVLPISGEKIMPKVLFFSPAWKRKLSPVPLWVFRVMSRVNYLLALLTGWAPLGPEVCPAITSFVFDCPPPMVEWEFVQQLLEIGPPPPIQDYIREMAGKD